MKAVRSRDDKVEPPSRVYYTGRQYITATIMICIKFTPCASRSGACRRRRAFESNLADMYPSAYAFRMRNAFV